MKGMCMDQYIYWHPRTSGQKKGHATAVIHLISDMNDNIANFQEMARKLRKTFPEAKNSDITAGRIYESSYVFGHSIIIWSAELPKKDYPGWRVQKFGKKRMFEYKY